MSEIIFPAFKRKLGDGSRSHAGDIDKVQQIVETARGRNALERCEKFMLANVSTPEEVLPTLRNP